MLFLQLDIGVPLPDPTSLMRKIIVKNKKKHFHQRGKAKADDITNRTNDLLKLTSVSACSSLLH